MFLSIFIISDKIYSTGVVRFLKYLHRHFPYPSIESVCIFDDKQWSCSDVIPALGQLYPEFFSGEIFPELEISYRGTLKKDVLHEYSRHFFK
jgi:hypothetical protein